MTDKTFISGTPGIGYIIIQNGVIDNMRSQRIETGYNRLFMIHWYEKIGDDIQHHSLPVAAYNEVARLVKGDNYQDGDVIKILGIIKTHRDELYIQLKEIQREGE